MAETETEAPGGAETLSIPQVLAKAGAQGISDFDVAAVTGRKHTHVRSVLAQMSFEVPPQAHFTGGSQTGYPKLWHAGPAPAPVTEPTVEKHKPDLSWLLLHGAQLAQENPTFTPAYVGNKWGEDIGVDPDHRDLLATAVQQTIIRDPSGATFVAIQEGNSRKYYQFAQGQIETAINEDIKVPAELRQDWSPPISTLARNGWSYDSTINNSHLNAKGEFRLKCWDLLPLVPKFDAEFDAYLRTLGSEQYEILCDWFVHSRRTDHPSVMLTLCGPNSTGKDLIPLSAAGGYVDNGTYGEGSLATNDFNTSITTCPFAVCSEGLPINHRGELIATSLLKSAISRQFHVINGKNAWPVNLYGNLRWVVSANSDRYYETKEVLSDDEINALCRRIVEIHMPQASAEYLERIGGMNHTLPLWITGERRAVRHVAWIVANHKIPAERADDRFGLREHAPLLRRYLQSNSPTAGTLITGLVGLLNGDPSRLSLFDAAAVLVGGGIVAVNAAGIAKHWRVLGSANAGAVKIPPQEHVIASEIRRISTPAGAMDNGLEYRAIKLDLLLGHARDMGLAVEALQERINLSMEEFRAWRKTIRAPRAMPFLVGQ